MGDYREKRFAYFMLGILVHGLRRETQLGTEYAGVLSSDDYSVYNGYPVKAQQKCLSHLRRHFKRVIKLGHVNNPAFLSSIFGLG